MLHLSIDDDGITLSGTEHGNQIHQALVPRPWVWSRHARGYVLPRSLLPLTRQRHITWLIQAAQAAGVPLNVEDTATAQTESQRRQDRTDRLEDRAERHEAAAERATRTAEATEAAATATRRHMPLGQPILVGHHSERRHRRDLERLDRLDRESLEAERTARRRAELAAGIRRVLDGGDSAVTIRLRIDRHEAAIRRLNRLLNGQPQPYTEHEHHLAAERDRLEEAVTIDRGALADMEARGDTVTYSRDNVRPGDLVLYHGIWYPVRRANRKSVTVPSIVGGDWTDTLPYAKITGCRRPEPA